MNAPYTKMFFMAFVKLNIFPLPRTSTSQPVEFTYTSYSYTSLYKAHFLDDFKSR